MRALAGGLLDQQQIDAGAGGRAVVAGRDPADGGGRRRRRRELPTARRNWGS